MGYWEVVLSTIGFSILWIIIAAIVAWAIGWVVDFVLDRTIEKKYLDKTKVGKELRQIGLDFSDTVGIFTAVFLFLYALSSYLSTLTSISSVAAQILSVVNYALLVTIVLAFFTIGLIFVAFLADYFGRLTKQHDENIAELLRNLIFIGFLWVVLYIGLNIWGLQYALINGIISGFVVLAIGWVVIDFFISKFEEGSFKEFSPYAKFFIAAIFILVAISAMFEGYLTDVSVIKIFAWGLVALFVISALPFVVKAIKELY